MSPRHRWQPTGPRDPALHERILAWAAEGRRITWIYEQVKAYDGRAYSSFYEYLLRWKIKVAHAPVLNARIEAGAGYPHAVEAKPFASTSPPRNPHPRQGQHRVLAFRRKKRVPVDKNRRTCYTCGVDIPIKTWPASRWVCPRCGRSHDLVLCESCGRVFARPAPHSAPGGVPRNIALRVAIGPSMTAAAPDNYGDRP